MKTIIQDSWDLFRHTGVIRVNNAKEIGKILKSPDFYIIYIIPTLNKYLVCYGEK